MQVQRKQVRIIVFILLIVISNPIYHGSVYGQSNEEIYVRDYQWYYGGYQWSWTLYINQTDYTQYDNVGLNQRFCYGYDNWDYMVTTNDEFVIEMASALHNASQDQNYNFFEEVSFILAFVQSLPYTSDSVTTGYDEYPRFPLETLVDNGGDCEDTSILFATLMLILGYGVVFINPTGHLAVGILGNEGLPGTSFEYDDKQYYFCETTGSGFGIGDSPIEFLGQTINIIPINTNRQFKGDIGSSISDLIPIILLLIIVLTVIFIIFKRKNNDKFNRINEVNLNTIDNTINNTIKIQENDLVNKYNFCGNCGEKFHPINGFCHKCGFENKKLKYDAND